MGLKRILIWNFLILLIYNSSFYIIGRDGDGPLLALIANAYVLGFHTLVILGIAIFYFIKKRQKLGQLYLLSAVLILLVGFSVCMGGLFIVTNIL